jgi:hypothetical protein
MFPVIDPEAIPSVNPRGFVNLLWKQLDHLGLVQFFSNFKLAKVNLKWF